ncbi:hypothetical protein MD484_g8492, partial [Candolleomyces efflorescens]
MSNPQQKRKLDPTPIEVKRARVAKPGPRSGFRLSSSSTQPAPRTSSVVTLKDNAGHRTGQRRVENVSLQPKQLDDRSKAVGTSEQLQGSSNERFNDQNLTPFDFESVPSNVDNTGRQKNGQKRTYENLSKLLDWIPQQQTFLDELLRHDGQGDYLGTTTCSKCSEDRYLPLHRIEVWTGQYFQKTSLATLGLRPKDFAIFDITGVHTVNLDFCGCQSGAEDVDKTVQLLRSSLFPATLSRPQTAFTFEMLDTFHKLTLVAKTTAYDYYHTILQRTDALELGSMPSRCNDFHRAFRFWRVLLMLKRAGRGNDPTGVSVRCTPGYDVTGAGIVICSRHGFVRPNGAGNLQKGERYSNMDYIIFCALLWTTLAQVVITYDIACQWSKNMPKRMDKLPKKVQLDLEKTTITAAVPSWHINGHGADCQTNYALAYRAGSGRTCGDEIESTWSQTNVLGASVREMASGGRHESLNDHFNGSNFRKMVGLRSLLPKKLREAADMKEQHHEAFVKLSATFSDDVKAKWTDMVSQWESDPSKCPNPYEDTRIDSTLQDVRLQLSREDAEEAAQGVISAHQTSTSSFLMTGIELEEQQQTLKLQIKGNRLTTSKQKADLEDKRTGLGRRINQWREVQVMYAPCIATLLPSATVDETEGQQRTTPEDLALYLPSALPATLRSTIPLLVEKEKKLREAQCDDALGEIRRQRRILTGLVQFKKLNLAGQGNKPNTRVRSLYNRIQTKITKAEMRYQAAHTALSNLDPNGDWSLRLQVLKPGDIRGPGRDPEEVSNGRFIMSWIWLVPRARSEGPDELRGDDLDESLRTEWVKARARVQRWTEEYLLVQEEMRRTVVYLNWKAEWWSLRAVSPPFRAADIAHGIAAYGAKQAAMCRQLGARFSQVWEPVLKRLGLSPQWISARHPADLPDIGQVDLSADERNDDDDENTDFDAFWEEESDVEGNEGDFELDDE